MAAWAAYCWDGEAVDNKCPQVYHSSFKVREEVEKFCLVHGQMDRRNMKLAESVIDHNSVDTFGPPPIEYVLEWLRRPAKDFYDSTKRNTRMYGTSISSNEPNIPRNVYSLRNRMRRCHRSRHRHRFLSLKILEQTDSVTVRNVLIPIMEHYSADGEYSLLKLIHNLRWYDNKVSSEMRGLRKMVAFGIKDQDFNEKSPTLVIMHRKWYNCACDSSIKYDCVTIWPLGALTAGPSPRTY